MAFELTNAQRNAVEVRNKSVLLSAAAGSGKTATLTRRIIDSIIDKDSPSDISRMLVVTFSRAAAAELRERISKALSDALAEDPSNTHLIRQTIVIGSASICTIDAFCLDVVKSNFQHLTFFDGSPLPPDFRIADEAEIKTLRLSVMNSTVDKWYSKVSETPEFPRFIENLTNVRGEGNLIKILLEYADFLNSVSNPDSFTRECANKMTENATADFFAAGFGKIIRDDIIEKIEYYAKLFADAVKEFSDGTVAQSAYLPSFQYDYNFCLSALDALNTSYDASRAVFDTYNPIPLGKLGKRSDDVSASFKSARDKFKKLLTTIINNYLFLLPEEISALAEKSAKDLNILGEFMSEYRSEYMKEKLSRRILEFSDVTRLTHSLLVNKDGTPTAEALSLRERFDEVYIDEYQDVDHIQDEIFNAVSRVGCRFMVGDIKQSIYSFRGAEPSIFGAMRRSMPPFGSPESDEKSACSIFMSDNFRCDKSIIDFVNLVSQHTFVPSGGTVGYCKDDDLAASKENTGEEPVTVALLKSGTADEAEQTEANYIVSEIKHLLKYGTKNDGTKITASDILILSRNNAFSAAVSSALSAEGIDCANVAESDFFAHPEIMLVLSLVTAIDNPQLDIPLAAALRSPFFDFTMDELVEIRRSADKSYSLYDAIEALALSDDRDELVQKCKSFVTMLEKLRVDARSTPVDRFVHNLYRQFGVMSLTVPNDTRTPVKISSNLRHFYEYARSFAAHQIGGLSGFVNFINGIIESEGKINTPGVAAIGGAVSVMTIHKSKGLEFPVVFLANCGKKFNDKTFDNPIRADADCGVALRQTDESGFARVDTPFRTAVNIKAKKERNEEEMRILYVALTRARERLYVVGSISSKSDLYTLRNNEKHLLEYQDRSSVLSAKCYLDWLLPAISREHPSFTLVEEIRSAESDTVEEIDTCVIEDGKIESIRKTLRERFDFVYHNSAARVLPAKLSVSRLYPEILDDEGVTGLEEKDLPELREKPLFMQEKSERHTSAERGTATHVFLQFCDFEKARENLRAELSRLVTERFMPEGTADLINIRQLENFFASALYKSVSNAKKVWREQRFNILLPASSFTADPELAERLADEKLLVQGVIDMFFIDGNDNIVLCDYKTDYLTPEELSSEKLARKKLKERHGEQLNYYAAAIEQLLGRKPDRICIYSLPFGKAINID